MPAVHYRPRKQTSDVVATHLPPHLLQYIEGVAQIQDVPISTVLKNIVQQDFDSHAAKLRKKRK